MMFEQAEYQREQYGIPGEVKRVATYGDCAMIYRAARVCTGHGFDEEPVEQVRLQRFLKTLLQNNHLRCFEFAGIVFGMRCPVFVERQLRTYRKPELERSLRVCTPIELSNIACLHDEENEIIAHKVMCLRRYNELREQGLSREEARRVLPLDIETETIAYYSLRCLFHVFEERLAQNAQSETRRFVRAMYYLTREAFPNVMTAYELIHGDMSGIQ